MTLRALGEVGEFRGDLGDMATHAFGVGLAADQSTVMVRALKEATPIVIEGQDLCEDCGSEIPEKRRKAVPGTRKCRDCKDAADKLSAMNKAPFRP